MHCRSAAYSGTRWGTSIMSSGFQRIISPEAGSLSVMIPARPFDSEEGNQKRQRKRDALFGQTMQPQNRKSKPRRRRRARPLYRHLQAMVQARQATPHLPTGATQPSHGRRQEREERRCRKVSRSLWRPSDWLICKSHRRDFQATSLQVVT